MSDKILLEAVPPLATVTLNRPARLNALDEAVWRLLAETVAGLDARDEIGAVVIRGAGDRAFSAGADVSEFSGRRSGIEQARVYGDSLVGAMTALAKCRHPTIAQISGICVGGGLELALACDLRICTQTSRFGVPVSRLGLTMSYAELGFLQRAVGPAVAAEILLAGEVFGAKRALRWGLVGRVVADEQLEHEVADLAAHVLAGAPLVHRWHKKFIRRLQDPTPLSDSEIDEGYACFGTEDYRRGVEAFLRKDKPKFEGR